MNGLVVNGRDESEIGERDGDVRGGSFVFSIFVTAASDGGIHEKAPLPFLMKTCDMAEDSSTDAVISWTEARDSFIVWDYHKFATTFLPRGLERLIQIVRSMQVKGF